MQVSWTDRDQADFIDNLRVYLADPENESIDYCVDAYISLAVRA